MHQLADDGLLDGGVKMRSMVLPDIYMDQDKPEKMYEKAGLDATGIVEKVLGLLDQRQLREALARRA